MANERLRHPETLPRQDQKGFWQNLRQFLIDGYNRSSQFQTATSTDYTTAGNVHRETVTTDATGTGTQTISLHATPRLGQKAVLNRLGTKFVKVDTSGTETIDGASAVTLPSQYDHMEFEAIMDDSTDTTSVNWTITSQSLGNPVFYDSTQTGTSAATSEEVLATYTMKADTLWRDDQGIKIKAWGSTAANGNTKDIRLRLGGVGGDIIADTTAVGANNKNWVVEGIVTRTGASTQDFLGESTMDDATSAPNIGTGSQDLTADVAVVVTGQNGTATANDIVYEAMVVELVG